MADKRLSARQREILEFIEAQARDRGYPPSVREIGEAVGLTSPSTVHSHLNTLSRLGYLRRDPSKPRAIEVRWDPNSGVAIERRPVRHVPLVGDVAAGTDVLAQENVEELLPVPLDFTGEGELFMLRVRGDSMVELGILDGDFVIAVQQPRRRRATSSLPASPVARRPSRRSRRTGTGSCSFRPTRRCSRWSSPPTTSPSTAVSSPSCAGSDRRRHAKPGLPGQLGGSSGGLTPSTGAGGAVSTGSAPGVGGAHGDRSGAALPGARAGSGGGGAATVAGVSGCCGLTGTCGIRGGCGGHVAASCPGRCPQPGPSGSTGVAARLDRRPASANSKPPSNTPAAATTIAPRRSSSTPSGGSRPTARPRRRRRHSPGARTCPARRSRTGRPTTR